MDDFNLNKIIKITKDINMYAEAIHNIHIDNSFNVKLNDPVIKNEICRLLELRISELYEEIEKYLRQ